ncbi:MAG: hypothetical protein ACLUTU_18100 [Blautia faecis]
MLFSGVLWIVVTRSIFYTSIGKGERGVRRLVPSNGSARCTEEDLQKWEKCGKPALNQKINGKLTITM